MATPMRLKQGNPLRRQRGAGTTGGGISGGRWRWSGPCRPMATAMRLKQVNPLRRHRRAGTTGADFGESARYSAAESSTASREVTQDDSAPGERNRTSVRDVVW